MTRRRLLAVLGALGLAAKPPTLRFFEPDRGQGTAQTKFVAKRAAAGSFAGPL